MFITLLSLVYFLVQIYLLHILRYAKIIATLSATLSFGFRSLLSFTALFGIFFMASSSGAYQMFTVLEDYSSLIRSMSTLASASMGKFNFITLIENFGNLGAFFLLAYLCVMFFIILNMFVTIINDSLAMVKYGEIKLSEECEVIDHMLKLFTTYLNGHQTTSKFNADPQCVSEII
jgi:hypothetical protein